MGFGTGLMKTLMFVFNGIVWILGLVMLIVGIVVLVEGESWGEIVDNKTVPVSVLLLVLGIIIAITGFIGCFGALKQNPSMLLVYAIILFVIVVVQLVAGILSFVYSEETEQVIQENMVSFIKSYTGDTDSNTDAFFNVVMEEFDCCGVNNASDFGTLTDGTKWVQANVPDSCCVEMTDNCGFGYDTTDANINHQAIDAGHSGFVTAMAKYDTNDPSSTRGINWLQKHLHCCGIQNASDWRVEAKKAKIWIRDHINDAPDHCCKRLSNQRDPTAKCGEGQALGNSPIINNEGCYAKMVRWIQTFMPMMGAMALIFLVLEAVAIVVSCLLRNESQLMKPIRLTDLNSS